MDMLTHRELSTYNIILLHVVLEEFANEIVYIPAGPAWKETLRGKFWIKARGPFLENPGNFSGP